MNGILAWLQAFYGELEEIIVRTHRTLVYSEFGRIVHKSRGRQKTFQVLAHIIQLSPSGHQSYTKREPSLRNPPYKARLPAHICFIYCWGNPPCSLLHFVVPLNSLFVRRRHTSLSALPSCLLSLLLRHRAVPSLLLRSSNIHVLAPVRLILLPQRFAAGLVVHIVVCDSPILALVVGYGLVLIIVGFRVEGDDVPGVDEAWDVAESAEEDVDEAVSGTDAGFDPDGDGREEDGEEAEEDVTAAHCLLRYNDSTKKWAVDADWWSCR